MAKKADLFKQLSEARAAAGVEDGATEDQMTVASIEEALASFPAPEEKGPAPKPTADPGEGDLVRVTFMHNGPRIVAEPCRVTAVHDNLVLDVDVLHPVTGAVLRTFKGAVRGSMKMKKTGVWIYSPG